ncbi:DUF1800 domain-containing protein [Lysobacter enzymogenes]|uniref:DUF1800 domain-containing protein n=1 Tax=Lysobacter enzymogenes TaxID=69 RepID=A0AAU9AI59_LYSEN|nr:DUF1800 domain-containing protein [Lysobacter enzymogenes]BAV98339.1 conserved hypothetical protein [Lysobacter enzymogenes]
MSSPLSNSERESLRRHLLQRYGALGRAAPSKAARAKLAGARLEAAGAAAPDVHAAPVATLPKDLPKAPFAVRALNNLSYGATAQSVAEFNALGSTGAQRLANWIDWQLDWSNIDDSALDARMAAAGYTTLGKSLTQLWEDHVKPNPAYDIRMRPAWEIQRGALVRAVHSKRQLREVMVNFWHDHFNVTVGDYDAGPVYVHYQRDVLRPHAFGNFRAMLEEVAKSTSMLYYLDNAANTRAGPNENFARELLELHTLGAEHYLGFMDPFQVPPDADDPNYPSGYTDIDVYETASAFTGWSVKNGHWQYPNDNDGSFVYRQAWHDAGPKFLLGRMLYPEQPALKDGRDVLDRLASHPGVARFICKKLIRRFMSDTPDPALVASAAAVFRQNWQAPDQIAKTLRHILNTDAFINVWAAKARRPFEAVAAAMRTLGSDWTIAVGNAKSDEFAWRMGFTGHAPYDWPAPNGYPDTREAWSGSSSYAMTWKLLNWLTETQDNAVPLAPILATTRSKVPSWTANALVDYWCQRLLGYQPTAARKQTLVAFMAQNGDPATYVITDTNAWAATDLKRHYNQERLRSMVSLILMSPEFLTR